MGQKGSFGSREVDREQVHGTDWRSDTMRESWSGGRNSPESKDGHLGALASYLDVSLILCH